jgi:membrane peptidoglycan carboxypeptidase
MTQSVNTVFYDLVFNRVGPSKVADVAHRAGIPDDLLPNPTGGIALGDKEVHPTDMAGAFATFANDGRYFAPHLITRVEAADGRVLYENGTNPGALRLSPQVARNVTESMTDVASASGIALGDGRPVAAKTGTVQHRLPGQNNDAWTVGYTPQLSAAVWIGSDDNTPIKTAGGSPIFGRMLPGQIWQRFMSAALRGQPVESFSAFVPLGAPPEASPTTEAEEPDEDSVSDSDRSRSSDSDSDSGDGSSDRFGGIFGAPGTAPPGGLPAARPPPA